MIQVKTLKPIGFIFNDTKKSVYNKNEVVNFLLEQNNNDQVIANKMFNDYWLNNKNILLMIPTDKAIITSEEIQIFETENTEADIEILTNLIATFNDDKS